MTYLLIDDDQDIGELLQEYFEQFQIELKMESNCKFISTHISVAK